MINSADRLTKAAVGRQTLIWVQPSPEMMSSIIDQLFHYLHIYHLHEIYTQDINILITSTRYIYKI